jgi:hypothetical protein
MLKNEALGQLPLSWDTHLSCWLTERRNEVRIDTPQELLLLAVSSYGLLIRAQGSSPAPLSASLTAIRVMT